MHVKGAAALVPLADTGLFKIAVEDLDQFGGHLEQVLLGRQVVGDVRTGLASPFLSQEHPHPDRGVPAGRSRLPAGSGRGAPGRPIRVPLPAGLHLPPLWDGGRLRYTATVSLPHLLGGPSRALMSLAPTSSRR